MRSSDFDLLKKFIRQYLIQKSQLTLLELECNNKYPKSEKAEMEKKRKKTKVEVAMRAEIKELEGISVSLRKDIGFVAIRSIWPGNTHRVYAHPKGNRDPSATQQKKSPFHAKRFQLMELMLEKLFALTNVKLGNYFAGKNLKDYVSTDFETAFRSGKESHLKRMVSPNTAADASTNYFKLCI
jgi:hypothetical protein